MTLRAPADFLETAHKPMTMKTRRVLLGGVLLTLPASAVTIDWLQVGDVNNPADPATGSLYGSVGYAYQIGKYEVTNAQYAEFLNAADSGATNTYSLYSTNMAGTYGGISVNAGASAGSKYATVAGRENKPVNYVSWFDAARMANWMHNGQGSGSTEAGAYNLNGATSGLDFTVELGAMVWIPSEDEWYKAAYYAVTGDNYWLYPTQSNSEPSNDLINPDPGNNAKFYLSGFTTGVAPYATDVGEFENSASYYGTFDQGGNVAEWNDAFVGSSRGLRGGMWLAPGENLLSAARSGSFSPAIEGNNVGFRLATIPEPSVVALLVLGTVMLRSRRSGSSRRAVGRAG